MKPKRNSVIFLIAALLAVPLCCLWWRHMQGTKNIPMDGVFHISTIYILTKVNGAEETYSLCGEEIPDSLESDLFRCIGQYSMTNAPISISQSMEITDSYIYISIWIFNMDGTSFRVNVSNQKFCSTVQFDTKHFGVINSGQMLDDIKSILLSIR